MKQATFNVKGMHCPSCEILIQDSLEELDGVNDVQVSHKDGTVKVSFDDLQVNEGRIKTVINNEGYPVE